MEIIADYRIISYRDNKPTKQVEDMIKYIEASKIINEKVYKFSDELQKYETNGGLVSDETRAKKEYQRDILNYDKAFKELQEFNKATKNLSKEYHKNFRYILINKFDLDLLKGV